MFLGVPVCKHVIIRLECAQFLWGHLKLLIFHLGHLSILQESKDMQEKVSFKGVIKICQSLMMPNNYLFDRFFSICISHP